MINVVVVESVRLSTCVVMRMKNCVEKREGRVSDGVQSHGSLPLLPVMCPF